VQQAAAEAGQQVEETLNFDQVSWANEEQVAATQPLEEEIAALKEELLRSQADMQNLRRRVDRDVENAHKYALEKFAGEMLSVVDNLERATATIDKENQQLSAVGEGVELTLKGLLDVLNRFKIEQVNPAGQPFDPDRHQAVATVPNPGVAANTVLEVFQKGYLLNGRLLRPAMVVVAKS
jgi:molecular chaperone GrpE